MVYNLADTFFIGQIGNPVMVAAVSLVSPWFNLLTALGNLFGLGGAAASSPGCWGPRTTGTSSMWRPSVCGAAGRPPSFSLATYLGRGPLLTFLGASPNTDGYAEGYLFWVVVLGGVPTMVSLTLGHLLRSEGHARQASAGMMFGGILNVVLDPVFIFGCHLAVTGAALATALSNVASVGFFLVVYRRLGGGNSVSRPVLYLPVFTGALLLRGAGLGPGHHLGQCRQHGDGAPGRRLWGHPRGGLRHCQTD